jgi:hypothetical protein
MEQNQADYLRKMIIPLVALILVVPCCVARGDELPADKAIVWPDN